MVFVGISSSPPMSDVSPRYLLTGDREVTTTLTVSEKDAMLGTNSSPRIQSPKYLSRENMY